MKYLYIFLSLLIFTGCTRVKYIEVTGTMQGIDIGAFVIRDGQGNIVMSETVFDGKFHSKKILQVPGYYSMVITPNMEKDNKKYAYDVYIDAGTYSVNVRADKMYAYPVIKTDSKKQNELSDYYTVANEKIHGADATVKTIYNLMYDNDSPAVKMGTGNQFNDELNKALEKWNAIEADVFSDYINKHPESDVAAHILAQIDYKKDPVSFYKIYQKFSDEQKNSVDGKGEGDDLKQLVKLAPGAPAPQLAGKTPDGKTVDPKATGKKVIILEFWRSDIEASRANHAQLLDDRYSPLSNKNVTAISVSLDTVQTAWAAAIKKDKMTWPQISDLKGEASPNMANWAIGTIPTYDLLDGNWHFIARDVEFNKLPLEIAKYLKVPLIMKQR